MTYEALEEIINNVFASQGRTCPEKIIKVWVKEIIARGFLDEAIVKAGQELMEEEEERLTLPKIMRIIRKYDTEIKQGSPFEKIKCKYCNGLNYNYTNIFFSKNGKYVSQNYAVKCFHNTNADTCAKMVLNEETLNKTESEHGYFLVFKSEEEREEYLKKVMENNGCDLWVKDNLGSKETEVVDDVPF